MVCHELSTLKCKRGQWISSARGIEIRIAARHRNSKEVSDADPHRCSRPSYQYNT